jgi:hypothetical protein
MVRAGSAVRGGIFAAVVALILGSIGARAAPVVPQARKQPAASSRRSTSAKPAAVTSTPKLEPRALDVLKSVRDRLAAARTLSFVAVDRLESRADEDTPRIQKSRFEVTLKRPDKLRVLVSSDAGLESQVNCNGRTMLTYTPATKAVSIVNAPEAIAGCLKHAYQTSAIDVAFVDLILAAPSMDLASGLQRAHYAGRLPFRGANADVIALSRDDMLVQMWVGSEDSLPKEVRLTSIDDPNWFRHTLTLSDWQINAAVPPEVFTAVKGLTPEHAAAGLPRPVGTSGIESVQREQPLTIHSYSSKYWGSGGSGPVMPYYGTPGYVQSPDGYYYPPQNYAFPPATAGYYGEPCYDCGEEWPEGAPGPGFNIALSTSGWYQPQAPPPVEDRFPTDPFFPGQIISRLPAGCAALYPGPAFYLCGDTWFAGVLDADGNLSFRVVGVTGY